MELIWILKHYMKMGLLFKKVKKFVYFFIFFEILQLEGKRMKKILTLLLLLILVTGCTDGMMNTPTKRVEEFLGKYQTMDTEVMNQLNDVISRNESFSEDAKEEYKNLMKKQYQNLMYKIKDETEDGNDATVEVEIEVFDYGKAMNRADEYLKENNKEFLNNGELDTKKFMDYKIKQMKETKEKVTYTLTFSLTKNDKKWVLDDVNEVMRQKIHGTYQD